MKIEPSYAHICALIKDVSRLLDNEELSDSLVSIHAHRLIWQWAQLHDVMALDRYCKCLFDSFGLAAARGLSGITCDVDRSVLSLKANICYYQAKIENVLATLEPPKVNEPACAA